MTVTRRMAIHSMAIAATTALLANNCATKQPVKKRPNIIFVMTDDQTVDQMSCYGHPHLKTPNMDRLAFEGTQFMNCFCTNSLCAPGRASILTGCYSSMNGIKGNTEKKGEVEALNPDIPTFPELLREAGYYTALIGKYHIRQDPKGFDDWRILPGQGSFFDPEFNENGVITQNEGYVTDVTTYKALDFLRNHDTAKPFCLVYQHKAPHRPFKPAPRHTNLWHDFEFPYPPSFNDDYKTRRIAKMAEDMRIEVSLAGDYPDMPKDLVKSEQKKWLYQRFVKDSCRAVVGVDENLGRILKHLDDTGIMDETVIIYTSDNGFFLGEHGWYDKRFMYEPSLRLPLVIRHPGIGTPGQVRQEMVQNIDVAPTILDIAGVPIPDVWQGLSLLPILRGETPEWRESVYYSYYEDSWRKYQNIKKEDITDETYKEYFTAHRVGPHQGIRTKRWKLIEYYTEGPYWELFDLENDPLELNNLYGTAGVEDITIELHEELIWLEDLYGDIQRP